MGLHRPELLQPSPWAERAAQRIHRSRKAPAAAVCHGWSAQLATPAAAEMRTHGHLLPTHPNQPAIKRRLPFLGTPPHPTPHPRTGAELSEERKLRTIAACRPLQPDMLQVVRGALLHYGLMPEELRELDPPIPRQAILPVPASARRVL